MDYEIIPDIWQKASYQMFGLFCYNLSRINDMIWS